MADLETSAVTPVGVWNFNGGAATNIFHSLTTGVQAAGTTQGTATALTKHINNVTVVATNQDGVKLPSAVAGMKVVIINKDATDPLKVWPATGDDLGAGVNAVSGVTILAGASRTYYAIDDTYWIGLAGQTVVL